MHRTPSDEVRRICRLIADNDKPLNATDEVFAETIADVMAAIVDEAIMISASRGEAKVAEWAMLRALDEVLRQDHDPDYFDDDYEDEYDEDY